MEEDASARGLSRRERIRHLGFNPEYLTPEEQRELLDLDAVLPSLEARVAERRAPATSEDRTEPTRY